MKTELLVQMDGLLASSEQVFLLAATNLPWELDMALLRRLEKRVLVPYPTLPARLVMLQKHLPQEKLHPQADLEQIAGATEGYSGSDLVLLFIPGGVGAHDGDTLRNDRRSGARRRREAGANRL